MYACETRARDSLASRQSLALASQLGGYVVALSDAGTRAFRWPYNDTARQIRGMSAFIVDGDSSVDVADVVYLRTCTI